MKLGCPPCLWRWPIWFVPLLLLAIAGCAGDERQVSCADSASTSPAASQQNLLSNPSFEAGRGPWFSLETEGWGTPFSVSTAAARSGASSALLEVRSDAVAGAGPVRVFGVVQELRPPDFPEVLSGYYCVERWEQGTPKQYLQSVVIVHAARNIPAEVASATNHQIRYILAGVESQPTFIGNARYVMVGRGAPKLGEWVRFERNVREDFQELWGDVPEGFASLRIFFETRWDDRKASDGPSAADVYYDDLYLGPAAEAP